MADIGNTGTPSQTFGFYGLNSSNILAIKVTMPQDGTITAVTCYMAAHGSGNYVNPAMTVWNLAGTVLGYSNALTIGAGSGGRGGQAFHTGAMITPFFVAAGTQLYIGFWRPANQSDEWTEQNGGTEYQQTSATGSLPPPNVPSWNTTGGQPAFYATYTPSVPPTITSFSPTHGAPGQGVLVFGSGFTNANGVSIAGTSVAFGVINDGELGFTLPSGTVPGHIQVSNPAGLVTSGAIFTPSNIANERLHVANWQIARVRRSSSWHLPTNAKIRRSGAWTVEQ